MRFWDSSALLPLLVEESGSAEVNRLFAEDNEIAIWWGTPTECWSALARREREAGWPTVTTDEALANLHKVMARAHEVLSTAAVRACSRRLLFTHSLRAADALQLAAAVVLGATEVAELDFVTLDEALAQAARREGFRVIPIATA
jgi:predicted nucleic acid-binding protein